MKGISTNSKGKEKTWLFVIQSTIVDYIRFWIYKCYDYKTHVIVDFILFMGSVNSNKKYQKLPDFKWEKLWKGEFCSAEIP